MAEWIRGNHECPLGDCWSHAHEGVAGQWTRCPWSLQECEGGRWGAGAAWVPGSVGVGGLWDQGLRWDPHSGGQVWGDAGEFGVRRLVEKPVL